MRSPLCGLPLLLCLSTGALAQIGGDRLFTVSPITGANGLFTAAIPLTGTGIGNGRWSIQLQLPPATPLDVFFQVAMLDTGRVLMSNGLHLQAR
jgi:hypothetical protein